jgi:hypothetical protein
VNVALERAQPTSSLTHKVKRLPEVAAEL